MHTVHQYACAVCSGCNCLFYSQTPFASGTERPPSTPHTAAPRRAVMPSPTNSPSTSPTRSPRVGSSLPPTLSLSSNTSPGDLFLSCCGAPNTMFQCFLIVSHSRGDATLYSERTRSASIAKTDSRASDPRCVLWTWPRMNAMDTTVHAPVFHTRTVFSRAAQGPVL